MTASITYWNRIEPCPESTSVQQSLQAMVRDPLWLLCRQWQLGEFLGADAGSPAYIELKTRTGTISGWSTVSASTATPFVAPPERVVQAEPVDATDGAFRIELGVVLRQMFRTRGIPDDLLGPIQNDYPYSGSGSSDQDPATAAFDTVCAGSALDGGSVLAAIRSHTLAPSLLAINASDPSALSAFDQWVAATYGEITYTESLATTYQATPYADPPTWDRECLDYEARVTVGDVGSPAVNLRAVPGRLGELDWYSYDIDATRPSPVGSGSSFPIETANITPIHVRFRGQPNARFWDFENASIDFGSVGVGLSDLSRMVFVEFMLTHGNDWFVLPLKRPVGSVVCVDLVLVHDVFGVQTVIGRADAGAPAEGDRWTMFSTTDQTSANGLADFLIVAPTMSASRQDGPVVEDVRFVRDEMADMAWAIEHTTTNAVGEPSSGYERDSRTRHQPPRPPPPPAPVPSTPPVTPLLYQLQSDVPRNWTPLVPVSVDSSTGAVRLVEGTVLQIASDTTGLVKLGKILQPTGVGSGALTIREEAVPRSGIRIVRVQNRARWIDGSTHVWIERRRMVGQGEGSSALRYDQALYQGGSGT